MRGMTVLDDAGARASDAPSSGSPVHESPSSGSPVSESGARSPDVEGRPDSRRSSGSSTHEGDARSPDVTETGTRSPDVEGGPGSRRSSGSSVHESATRSPDVTEMGTRSPDVEHAAPRRHPQAPACPTATALPPAAPSLVSACAQLVPVLRAEPAASVDALAEAIYAEWFGRAHRTLDVVVPTTGAPVPTGPDGSLVGVFRAVDATAMFHERGWITERVGPDGQVIARRGRDVRLAHRCDYTVEAAPAAAARPGDRLVMAGRRDRVDPDGSWWRTAGRGWRFSTGHGNLVRVYWNLTVPGAVSAVGQITGLLGAETAPWMLKCAASPEVHTRADAVVLYLDADLADRAAAALGTVAAGLAVDLLDETPPLTLRLRPGVAAATEPVAVDADGVAVDASGDESFGSHRARLAAEALGSLDVPARGVADARSLATLVGARFSGSGIDPATPWRRGVDRALPWEADRR